MDASHGLPDILVSDRGSQWLSEFWRKLFKHCGTNLRFSTAYHPETDGLSERTIRTVIDTLRCCLDGTHEVFRFQLNGYELLRSIVTNEAAEPKRGSEATKPWEKERPRGPRDAADTSRLV